jgi:hypothetical protein
MLARGTIKNNAGKNNEGVSVSSALDSNVNYFVAEKKYIFFFLISVSTPEGKTSHPFSPMYTTYI